MLDHTTTRAGTPLGGSVVADNTTNQSISIEAACQWFQVRLINTRTPYQPIWRADDCSPPGPTLHPGTNYYRLYIQGLSQGERRMLNRAIEMLAEVTDGDT